jgi:hypothetical protein
VLHEFLTSNRQILISRCRENVTRRFASVEAASSIDHGVPLFLQQLVETLRDEQNSPLRAESETESTPAATKIGRAAALHGAELLRRGFSVDQVVHDYGDVCQCVTALAVEQDVPISTDEFRTLNRCLDNAIADAVASYGSAHQTMISGQAETLQQRLVAFAHEHRRLVDIALKSIEAIKTGNIGIGGPTGQLLIYALTEMSTLTDRTLPEIRLASPGPRAVSASGSSIPALPRGQPQG